MPIADVQKLVLTGSAAADVPQTFAEFLALIAGRTQMQIELKQQANPDATKKLAASRRRVALRGYRAPTRSNRSIRTCWSPCTAPA